MFKGKGQTLGGSSTPSAPSQASNDSSSSNDYYRDPLFAVAFLLQLVAVVGVAAIRGYPALRSQTFSDGDDDSKDGTSGDSDDWDWIALAWTTLISLGSAWLASVLCLGLMLQFAGWIVPLAFAAAPATAILTAAVATFTLGFSPTFWYGAASVTAMTAATYYLFARKHVPFAASTLRTALSALKENSSLMGLALVDSLCVALWTVLWAVGAYGAYTVLQERPDDTTRNVAPCPDDPHRMCEVRDNTAIIVTVTMGLSYFWTCQVLQNILHTTTAGTLASWWVRRPGSSNDPRSEMWNALLRSCTLSLGSICLGSLIVAAAQLLERIVANANRKKQRDNNRNNNDSRGGRRRSSQQEQNGNPMAEWLLAWLRKLTEYVNSWAFVYVGTYGYTYIQAGKTVAALVSQRGWSSFVSDRLIYRVLGLAQLCIAVCTGVFASVMSGTLSWLIFGVGCAVGWVLSSTSLFVVESAVRTVIVCFAEHPHDFEVCHPALHKELQQGWSSAYPEAWAGQHHRRG